MNAPQENRVVSPHVLGEGSPQRQYASKGSHGVAAMALYTFTALSTRHKHGNGKSETERGAGALPVLVVVPGRAAAVVSPSSQQARRSTPTPISAW